MSTQNSAVAAPSAEVVPTSADKVAPLTAAQFATPRCIRPSAPDGLRLARCS
jgi:hypothetical protein